MGAPLRHVPVMLAEVLEGLRVRPDGIYLDGTFGRGGHARAVLAELGPAGRLLLMDRDPEAIARAEQEFGADPRVGIRHARFERMQEWPEAAAGLDGVLLDLGVSSPQLDDPSRGFSFQTEGPLDMRMDPTQGTSAAQWLATADEGEIASVLWRHGEERMSRRIARAIVERRGEQPLATTRELADLVARSIGSRRERHKHPATRTFQALRIHVNDEIGALERGLAAARACLRPGGRLVVISFHSLEDRIAKQFIRGEAARATRRGLPPPDVAPPAFTAIGKARFAGEAETAANPRARSAVLRVADRTDAVAVPAIGSRA
jgi:16S rRNA (cytosine1402-N4)-methyltransferase